MIIWGGIAHRWAAATELHERWGALKEEIDGGFEYNNLLDSRERLRTRWIHRPGVADVIREDPTRPFRLAFEPLTSYENLAAWSVDRGSRAACGASISCGGSRSLRPTHRQESQISTASELLSLA